MRSALTPGSTRSPRSAPTVIIHFEDRMKHSFTLAAFAAVVMLTAAVACSDYSATPTGTYGSRTDSTTTSTTPSYLSAKTPRVGFGFNGTASGFPLGAVFLTGGGSY